METAMSSVPAPAEPVEEDPVETIFFAYRGDPRAAIAGLLADIEYLRRQIDYASLAVSPGYTRGWRPTYEGQLDHEQ
jgi:GT2 family glycosyltransferase